jgi:holo-ACP synthase/triphosphoribosyl-dephospho-CoA synthase
MEATLQDILDARENRVQRQQALLSKYQTPLICFTMNIPGPEKMNRDVSIGFSVGNWLLQQALRNRRILHREIHKTAAGYEAFYVVDLPPRELKQIAIEVEDTQSIGRLFDIDVLSPDGAKLTREDMGQPRRKCLLCDNDASVCARSRAHGLEALQDRTGFLLYLSARQWMTEQIAAHAFVALNQEFLTTPKPGLVDKNNQGAHKDMGIRHFFASANALRPFFCRFAETGFLTRDLSPEETFARIRPIGMEAEQEMLRATGGVNTHKGAIFTMGLLCAAAGRLSPDQWQTETLLAQCAAMTKGLVAQDFGGITPENAKTAGERIFAMHGVSGVRGQAEAGFPAIAKAGLPILRQGLSKGLSLNDAGCITLLHLLAETDDTNLIHRSDYQTQQQIRRDVTALLEKDPFPSLSVIEELDRDFIQRNLSPGGSADLLAATFFLYFLERSGNP